MFRIWEKDGISCIFWITVLLLRIHRLRVSENSWHVSLLARPGLRLTCPVQTVQALLGGGVGTGLCSVLAIIPGSPRSHGEAAVFHQGT